MLEYQESIMAGKIEPNNLGYFSKHFIWEHCRDWSTSQTGKAFLSFVVESADTLYLNLLL